MTNRLKIAALLCAILLSGSIRYFYVYRYAGFSYVVEGIGGDAQDYLDLSYSLAKTGVFGHVPGVDVKRMLIERRSPPPVSNSAEPDAFRTPIWPLMLSLIMRASSYDFRTMFTLRFLLDAVTLVMFYRLLSYIDISDLTRLAAVVLLAVHPAWVIYSVTFLSEPFTILAHIILAISCIALTKAPTNPMRIGAVGILSGLTVLVHPYYALLPLSLVAILLVARLIRPRVAGIILVLAAAVVTPWVIRNMMVFHTTKPILTTASGKLIARGWHSQFLDVYRNTTGDHFPVGAGVDVSTFNPAQRSDAYLASAVQFVKANWRLAPAIITRKIVGALMPFPETSREGFLETGRTAFQVLSFCSLLIVFARSRGGWLVWLLGAEYIAYLGMGLLTVPTLRYRVPLIWVEVVSIVAAVEIVLKTVRPPAPALAPEAEAPVCTSAS
jgi:hypothetical protein